MTQSSRLFSPIQFGPLALHNRIMVSPMCQYSAVDGSPGSWHLVHLGSLAISGAGLLCLEATAVLPDGRITPGCLGLYSDGNEAALQWLVEQLRSISDVPLAIQLSHAGRKGSSSAPWEGGNLIPQSQGGWRPLAPSAVPQRPEEPAPQEMSSGQIREVIDAFVQAAQRARRLGFQAIEVHMAHGYLLHQFLSPLSNQRSDAYGGGLENRLRLPLEVFDAVVAAAGPDIAVGVRLSATDWVDGGWDLAQTIAIARRLEDRGCAFLDISTGGLSHQQKVTPGPAYQTPFAAEVRRAVRVPVVTVGLITQPAQAESILERGDADAVALARGFLQDPRWPWRAAAELGGTIAVPKPLLRSLTNDNARIARS